MPVRLSVLCRRDCCPGGGPDGRQSQPGCETVAFSGNRYISTLRACPTGSCDGAGEVFLNTPKARRVWVFPSFYPVSIAVGSACPYYQAAGSRNRPCADLYGFYDSVVGRFEITIFCGFVFPVRHDVSVRLGLLLEFAEGLSARSAGSLSRSL